jgi:hypothetical protein
MTVGFITTAKFTTHWTKKLGVSQTTSSSMLLFRRLFKKTNESLVMKLSFN